MNSRESLTGTKERARRDRRELPGVRLAVRRPDDSVRIEDVAPGHAEHFQGSHKDAEVVEILRGVEQDLHQRAIT
jgi:hypothetical protein